MTDINQLPYFQINNTKESNDIAKFLLEKVKKEEENWEIKKHGLP